MRNSAAFIVQRIRGFSQKYGAIIWAWQSSFSNYREEALRIPHSRGFNGIYESVNESVRLPSLRAVEPISCIGRGEPHRPFFGGGDGPSSTRGPFVVLISFLAQSTHATKRLSRVRLAVSRLKRI